VTAEVVSANANTVAIVNRNGVKSFLGVMDRDCSY
jgi:hypothetical protein